MRRSVINRLANAVRNNAIIAPPVTCDNPQEYMRAAKEAHANIVEGLLGWLNEVYFAQMDQAEWRAMCEPYRPQAWK